MILLCGGTHRWVRCECMVCTVCEECTGYGSSCVSTANPEHRRLPGQYVCVYSKLVCLSVCPSVCLDLCLCLDVVAVSPVTLAVLSVVLVCLSVCLSVCLDVVAVGPVTLAVLSVVLVCLSVCLCV